MANYPEEIYLEPDCPNCGEPSGSDYGRQWCEDDVWSGDCEGCGVLLRSPRYVLEKQND